MTHKPIHLDQLSFILPHKTCFHEPQVVLRYGQRIALIGNNGSGKSTLLKMLLAHLPVDVRGAYVPQIHDGDGLSGAEQFQRKLSAALVDAPNLLLLDEPTNHLDKEHRNSLKRMLAGYAHTLVVATHDQDLLRQSFDGFWHLRDGQLRTFYGAYDDYIVAAARERNAVIEELLSLKKNQKDAHASLMREQKRAKASRLMGEKSIEQRKWPTIVSSAKARRAEQTSGKKQAALKDQRSALVERLDKLRVPEVLTPKFHFESAVKSGVVLVVREGFCGYKKPVVHGIEMSLRFGERLSLRGKNASGKSTVLKALLGNGRVHKGGFWQTPRADEIGYLDQNYRTLSLEKTAVHAIAELRPDWTVKEIRHHLNAFLFRKNEEVMAPIKTLSGGERARLSLCLIAAKSPRLLLLDEITNNVDGETREHLIAALNAYEGSIVVISHDEELLRALRCTSTAEIIDGRYV